MTWTKPAEVKARWIDGDVPVSDEVLAVLIQDAEDAITVAIPDCAERVLNGTIPPGRIARVVSRMLIRLLRNPTGIRTVQETTGQFSGSTTYAGDSLGEIQVTDADRRELLGKAAGRRAFSVMPGGIR